MCGERSKSCCSGECAGHCNKSNEDVHEISLNTVVELEIHYIEIKEAKMAAYIFKSLYCLTNVQRMELKITGLEGNRYNSLDIMRLKVIDTLAQIDNSSCESYKDVDVTYIGDDV